MTAASRMILAGTGGMLAFVSRRTDEDRKISNCVVNSLMVRRFLTMTTGTKKANSKREVISVSHIYFTRERQGMSC